MEKELSPMEMEVLNAANIYLLEATKIDFKAWLDDCAQKDSCTEIEVGKFLRENYPKPKNGKYLVEADKRILDLLIRYYFEKAIEYETSKEDSLVSYTEPRFFYNSDHLVFG